MPKFLRKCVKNAENYEGSEVQMLVEGLYGAENDGDAGRPASPPLDDDPWQPPPANNTGHPATYDDDDIPF
jgi:single-stranded DNA-binding protein